MKRSFLFIFLIIILVISSCSKKKGTIVAKVNDHVLTLEVLQNSYPSVEWNNMTNEQKRDLINKWVELTLLSDKADDDDFLNDNPVIKFKIENAEKKVKANAYIAQQISALKVSDEELFNYYRVHQGEFKKNIQSIKVQRILVKTLDEANHIKSLLDTGALKFTPAAIQYSQEPIGKTGGYMAQSVNEFNEKEIWNALNSLKIFDITIMPYNNDYLVLRSIESASSQQEGTFEDVKIDIEHAILQNKRNEIYNKIINEVKKESNITISF